MILRAAILGLALALGALSAARAEDSIWAALGLMTNEHPPKPAPRELARYAAEFKAVFGYNTCYLLGDRTKQIVKGTEAWIVPTKKVYLKVRCLDRGKDAYTVHLELYLRKQLIVSCEARLGRGAPLYIRGPAWGRGRLIFVLEVR